MGSVESWLGRLLVHSHRSGPGVPLGPLFLEDMIHSAIPFFFSPCWRTSLQFIDIGMEDPVHEPNRRRLVRVLIRELHMDFPDATGKGRYREEGRGKVEGSKENKKKVTKR